MRETGEWIWPSPAAQTRVPPVIVQDFARQARAARDFAGLRVLLVAVTRALGFQHILLQGACGTPWLVDLPQGFDVAVEAADDAVLAAASQCFAPFLWSDIPRLLALTPGQRGFLQAAEKAGLGAAVTVPVHRARGSQDRYSLFAGCCSFLMQQDQPLPLGSLAEAHYVGALAFDAAENLRRVQALSQPAPLDEAPHLTPRQRDCVVLVAQGKSDWEIGRLLGISESTVHKHIEDAKRRFGVSTRIQLVVRSLFDAKLSFADVMK